MLHSQELTNLGSNPVHPGSKSNLLYILLCFQIHLEIKVPVANAFVVHILFTLKERQKLKPHRPWTVMIKFIDNSDQEIIAQVFGSSRGRLRQKIGKSICEIFALCHCAFIQLLLSHSILFSHLIPPLFGSPQHTGCCVHVHIHTHKDSPAFQLPGCKNLLEPFSLFLYSTFWCVACTILSPLANKAVCEEGFMSSQL